MLPLKCLGWTVDGKASHPCGHWAGTSCCLLVEYCFKKRNKLGGLFNPVEKGLNLKIYQTEYYLKKRSKKHSSVCPLTSDHMKEAPASVRGVGMQPWVRGLQHAYLLKTMTLYMLVLLLKMYDAIKLRRTRHQFPFTNSNLNHYQLRRSITRKNNLPHTWSPV